MAAITLIMGLVFWSAPPSGDEERRCPCGGACNHTVTPEIISKDFLPPIWVIDSTSGALILSAVAVMDSITCATGWCINLIYRVFNRLRLWRQSFGRYLLTGYWQELDYCPVCRGQEDHKVIKHGSVNSPHLAFAMLLAWLKDQRIPHQTVRDYLQCMNSRFSVLRLLAPALSSEYHFKAADYPILYLSPIINSFAEAVPYQTMIFVDNQFGHMVGIIQTEELQFSVYFASINRHITINGINNLEITISRFYRSISSLWESGREARIVLIGIDR